MLSAAISAPPVAFEDEGALDDGLCVQRERFRRPIGCHVPLAHRRVDNGP